MAVDYPRGAQEPISDIIADRHLYLDASESTVVEEGDARSAYQFVAKGHPIAKADAERLGLSVSKGVIVLPDGVSAQVEVEAIAPPPVAPKQPKGAAAPPAPAGE